MSELLKRINDLPEKLANRTMAGWAIAVANRMTSRLRMAVRHSAFKSGRTTGSIRAASVRPQKARAMFGAIARALSYSSNRHGGSLWNLLNRGTKQRFARANRNSATGRFMPSDRLSAYASRGRGPRLAIAARFGPGILAEVLPDAEKDLAKRIERAWKKAGNE